jgi:proton-dependent oligopeptide transporter, POT family
MIREASKWILQADQMVRLKWYSSAQMKALNPALVMIVIPFNNLVLYPALRRWGRDVRSHSRLIDRKLPVSYRNPDTYLASY